MSVSLEEVTSEYPSAQKRRPRCRRTAVMAAAIAVGLIAASCGSSSTPSASSAASSGSSTSTAAALTAVSIQVYPADMFSMPIFAAQDEGFFKKNNLAVSLVPTNTGPASIAALSSGSVDAIGVSPEVIFAAIASGLRAQVWSGLVGNPWEVLANKSLYPSGNPGYPTDLKALAGKVVGVPTIPSAGQAVLEAAMLTQGMKPSEIHLVAVGLGATAVAAMDTGRVDAVVVSDPSATEILNSGKATVVLDYRKGQGASQLVGPYVGMWSTTAYIKAHPSTISALRRAISEADAWLANPANTTAEESLFAKVFNSSSLNSSYPSMIAANRPIWTSKYTETTLKAFDSYDVKYGFLKAPISTSGLLAAG